MRLDKHQLLGLLNLKSLGLTVAELLKEIFFWMGFYNNLYSPTMTAQKYTTTIILLNDTRGNVNDNNKKKLKER